VLGGKQSMKNLEIEAEDAKLTVTNATLVRAVLKLGERSVVFHITEYNDTVKLFFTNGELCFINVEVDANANTG